MIHFPAIFVCNLCIFTWLIYFQSNPLYTCEIHSNHLFLCVFFYTSNFFIRIIVFMCFFSFFLIQVKGMFNFGNMFFIFVYFFSHDFIFRSVTFDMLKFVFVFFRPSTCHIITRFTLIMCSLNACYSMKMKNKSSHYVSKMRSAEVDTAHLGVLHVNTLCFAYVYSHSLHISLGFFPI